ncbi:MAG: FAD-dependent oxidoreductase [Phycisphaeraceae bacterium]|nr:FAD-dependent oxidoreductase [Phycisphaeraceae bacterium]
MSKPHKLVIIGSGPSGWTAAIYAARAQLQPVVYIGVPKADPGPILPGGQLMLTTEVENYPGFEHGIKGPEMMDIFQKQAVRFGSTVIGEDITRCEFAGVELPLRGGGSSSSNPAAERRGHPESHPAVHMLHTSGGKTIHAHAVIIATGATANWLGLPNEQRLATQGGGVSACAVCDGALPAFRNQRLLVVGGGDTALEEATYLTKFASEVFIIHRRDKLRASKIMQDRYFSRPNAKVLWNKQVVDVLGQEMITGVRLQDTVTGESSTLDCKGLFIAIGHTPATKFLKGSGLEFDENGYIHLKNRNSYTNIPGVFAAGDVADHEYRQAVTAAGMGCMAALDAERWLAARGVD